MNVCLRRMIQTNLISPKVSALKRGMLTCHGKARQNLVPFLALQDKQVGLMDISDKLNDLPMKNNVIRSTVTDPVVVPRGEIGIPISVIIHDFELPTLNNREMIDPVENVIEKKAHRLLRIRKKKMKRHKWKKLQRRMRFAFAKIRRRRRARKEAIHNKELKEIIKAGEAYDPQQELNEKIDILRREIPINRINGYLSPKWAIDQYLVEEKKKRFLEDRIAHCLKKMQ